MTKDEYNYIVDRLLEVIYTCNRIASDPHTSQWARDRASTAQQSASEALDKLRTMRPDDVQGWQAKR